MSRRRLAILALSLARDVGDPMFANLDADGIARSELAAALGDAGFTVICTLFVIPAVYGDRYELRATMTDRAGTPLGQRVLQEELDQGDRAPLPASRAVPDPDHRGRPHVADRRARRRGSGGPTLGDVISTAELSKMRAWRG